MLKLFLPSNFNVDKVGEVDKINDTVNISEDLKYWREIAEQDAINKFITMRTQTQITFSGDIKETVDIEKMADIIAEKNANCSSYVAPGTS